jgi:hypothetical protein
MNILYQKLGCLAQAVAMCFAVFLFLPLILLPMRTFGQGVSLSAKEQKEVRETLDQLVEVVRKRAELNRQRQASEEDNFNYNKTVKNLYLQIHSYGTAAIPTVFEIYKSALHSPQGNELRSTIVNLVFKTWDKEKENPLLVSCISQIAQIDPDAQIRQAASRQMLAKPHLYRDVLKTLLDDGDLNVQVTAGLRIEQLGVRMTEPDPQTVELLMSLLSHKSLVVRYFAALGICGGKVFTQTQKKQALDAVVEKLDIKDSSTVLPLEEGLLPTYTGQFFGRYDPPMPAPRPSDADKQKIVSKWKDWWAANRDKLQWDEKKKKFVLPDEKKKQ